MSRDMLIHTLRDALDTLTQKVWRENDDIQIPELDDELIALAEGKPRRSVGPPLYW